MISNHEFDLIISGAGPAGCTLALKLAGKGLRIAIVEKDVFPRHKICGDALSGKVVSVMKRLHGGIYGDFLRQVNKVDSWGIRFTSPNFSTVDVPFTRNRAPETESPGFVCRRSDFDNFLFTRLKDLPDVRIFEGERVAGMERLPDRILLKTEHYGLTGQVVAGADGVHSPTRRSLSPGSAGKEHFCVGIRGYYENVGGLHPENFIELIFLKELLPGYFWIFPSANGLVNAGFGMLQSQVTSGKVNLNRILGDLISGHPHIAPRFREARPAGKAEAHTLPLGSFRFSRSGERYLLTGDAAFLVDPFSGEGIGNAMASGEIAAEVLEDCFRRGDFSAEAMAAYDARIQRRFSQEFRTTAMMQRLARRGWLVNLVVGKARKSNDLRDLLTAMFTNEDIKEKLTKPGFYAGLLFR